MKSLNDVNKKNDVSSKASETPANDVKAEQTAKAVEKIDFTGVKVEPLFEEFDIVNTNTANFSLQTN